MIEIIEPVVVVAEGGIGVPHIAGGPVVQGGRRPHVFKLAADPAGVLIAALPVEKPPVPLQRLIGPDSQEAHRLLIPVPDAIPAAELPGQVLLVHLVTIGGNGIVV